MSYLAKQGRSKATIYLINLLFWLSLCSGIILRFSHLDSKVFWHDEVYTELRVSGYKNADPLNARQGKIISKSDLLEFQGITESKNVLDTMASLKEDVHVPLYYLLLRYWQAFLGNSIKITRAFSALWGSLSLLGIYLLTKKVFNSQETARIATSLAAVSPMLIRYSQDARPYSLWFASGIFSTLLLLSALEKDTLKSWLWYGLSFAATFYTQLLSVYFYAGHGLYVLVTKGRSLKTLARYAIASGLGVLLFLPWLVKVILPNFGSMTAQTSWLKIPMAFEKLLQEQIANLNHLFISLDFTTRSYFIRYSLSILIAVLVIYSFYVLLVRQTVYRWSIPIVLSLSSFIFLYQDLVLGGQRTRINQYFLFSYLGIFIAVGFTIAFYLSSPSKLKQRFWSVVYCTIIIAGLFTNVKTASAQTWWGWSVFQADMANIINKAERPLVISQDRIGNIMPLFYLLDDKTKSLMLNPKQPVLPQGVKQYDIFLLNPSEQITKSYLKQSDREIDLVYKFREGFIDIKLYRSR